jgi:hypothetical protein
MPRTWITLGLFLAAAVAAAADEPKKPDPATLFKLADTNKDGKVSQDEFLKLLAKRPRFKDNPDLAKKIFETLDTDKDGFLTPKEFEKIADLQKRAAKAEEPGAPATGSKTSTGFADKPTQDQVAFFEKKIRPVLVEQCYKCHSSTSEKLKGGLLLDTRDGVHKGGDTGPAIVPGEPNKSLVIKALRYKDESMKMPPKQKLPDAVIADFEQWVKMGAPDPRGEAAAVAKAPAVKTQIDIEKGRQFWAFQPPKKAAPPVVRDTAWPKTDVDRFLLAGLEAKGLKPVADADKRTLVRRVFLDLTGLPPTPEQADEFVNDESPEALEKLVDKLLAVPAFGERWGRHWLDVARFAESSGKSANINYPHAWRYRDYVIAAYNADKPFDRFIKEQLAGDLLPAKDEAEKAEHAIATGFLAVGMKALNERNPEQFRMDLADEQIDTFSQAFLGMTAACARCHDHKFDPIPSRDYYALAGIFKSTETCYGTIRFVQSQRPSPLIPLSKASGAPASTDEPLSPEARKRIEEQIATLRKQAADDVVRRVIVQGQTALLQGRIDLYDADGNAKLLAMGARDRFRTENSPVYARGEVDKPGEVVPRGVLQVVSTNSPKISRGSGRLELADWVATKDNPLTARVYVNRVWLHLFGRGIVPTPDNFGTTGLPPANQQLLDSLAVWFEENGWSTKKLVKHLVLSHAYQLSAKTDPANFTADPDNALVWRMTPSRLDAESLRDSLLIVSGRLDARPARGSAVAKAGDGPSVAPGPGGRFGVRRDPDDRHRSVYMPIVRDNLPESLALFDGADPNMVMGERANTTVPAQALFLMNNPFVLKSAEAAADRLLAAGSTDSDRVRQAYRLFFGRPASDKEVVAAEGFLTKYAATAKSRSKKDPWAALCQAMFASAEFLMRN